MFIQAPLLLMVLLFTVLMLLFYPGYLQFDAAFQIAQGLQGGISNLHPPLTTWMLVLAEKYLGGYGVYWSFSIFVYFLACIFFSSLTFRGAKSRAILTLSLAFLPPIFADIPNVGKDMLCSAMIMLSFCCMYADFRLSSLRMKAGVIIFALLAAAIRHNAIFSVLPMVMYVVSSFMKSTIIKNKAHLGMIFIISFMGLICSQKIFDMLADKRVSSWTIAMLWDVAEISVIENKLLIPPSMLGNDNVTLDSIRPLMNDGNTVPICSYQPEGRLVKCLEKIPFREGQVLSEDQTMDVLKLWLSTIYNYPISYINRRAIVTCNLLGICRKGAYIPFSTHPMDPGWLSPPRYLGAPLADLKVEIIVPSETANRIVDGMHKLYEYTPLISPWFYVVIMIVAFIIIMRREPSEIMPAGILLISSFLCIASLAIFTPDTTIRYLQWPVIAGAMMLTISLKHHLEGSKNSSSSSI